MLTLSKTSLFQIHTTNPNQPGYVWIFQTEENQANK
jgi:hypothetical protein